VAPISCWVGGALLLSGSAFLFYLGGKGGSDDHNEKYRYRGATAAAFAVGGAGAVAIGVGVWLWMRGSRESAPVASVGPGGGYLGWSGRF
jgi:hypothetical protein